MDWLIKKKKKIGSRFLVKVSLCQISALRDFPVAQNQESHFFPFEFPTGGSRSAEDQRKKSGLDFDLRKTCTKFHPKILTLSVSNLGAENTPKSHFWTWLHSNDWISYSIVHHWFHLCLHHSVHTLQHIFPFIIHESYLPLFEIMSET
jgi:hypothetical protein